MGTFATRLLLAFSLSAGAAALSALPPSVHAAATDAGTAKGLCWGGIVDGLRSRIRLVAPRPAFDGAGPILIGYEVENAGAEPRMVLHSGFWPNHRIEVLGPDGRSLQATVAGQRLLNASAPGSPREKNAPVTLRPGARDAAWQDIDLARLFVFGADGRHLVTVTYTDGDRPLVSNTLEFVIRR